MNNNAPSYLLIACLFIVCKLGYQQADTEDLLFVLQPSNLLVSYWANSEAVYQQGLGFVHETLAITIGKSCSGINFAILCLCLFLYSLWPRLHTWKTRLSLLPIVVFIVLVFTVFVNASRICITLVLEQQLELHYTWLHQVQGAFVYLSFLVAFYLITEYTILKYLSYAKHSKS